MRCRRQDTGTHHKNETQQSEQRYVASCVRKRAYYTIALNWFEFVSDVDLCVALVYYLQTEGRLRASRLATNVQLGQTRAR